MKSTPHYRKGRDQMKQQEKFDYRLADECSRAFCASTGLGCTVSDTEGSLLFEHGYGCHSCGLCRAAGLPDENCIRAHNYGMMEAERFGGKYIYFCPLGLTCFVSPIIGDTGSMAKITVGPFLMVELQDFIDCELKENLHLDEKTRDRVVGLLENVPRIMPQKVQELSILLFMAVGFLNNVSAENRLLAIERSDLLQGQISGYISQLKNTSSPRYPFELERALLEALSRGDRGAALSKLQEYLAALFAAGGGNPDWMNQKAQELIVLLSRTLTERGADEQQTLFWLQRCQKELSSRKNFHELSAWLYDALTDLLDSVSSYSDARHANIIHRCIQYIGTGYADHLTLESVARALFLSPDYLSRIFSRETGTSFNRYLNNVRITKAKELIRSGDLRLTDISQMVGYDDQSYFTKVFRRIEGMSPNEYRKKVCASMAAPAAASS